ncbi:hypothetical protein TRFO_25486 [Tritrichomonas foetus]|uniref:Uncharacterized protein n=1 Tax=Tritrichomonas foetus TaxID=1144522 RepID=A0A1J4K9Z2_9EUKA|nr:hypothetical protein TRFO_25486 [Tritrichomonas foetus]|eukprot:OHT06462.1 hypothetical protein TRFO_25486 [Tritrichomonas foetus]
MNKVNPDAHFFLNDWLQNRFLIFSLGTTGAGKTHTAFNILKSMYKYKNPPSHFIVCSTSGGLDRTLRKQLKTMRITCPTEFCFIDELPDIVQEIIAAYKCKHILEKLLQKNNGDLIDMVDEKLSKLEDDIQTQFEMFDVLQEKLQTFIENIRSELHRTITKKVMTNNGKTVTVEEPAFTLQCIRNGLKYYKKQYGSRYPINIVVLIDDYLDDKNLTKRDTVLSRLIIKRRHLGLSFVINLQRLIGVNKTLRSIANTYILFKGVSAYDLESICQTVSLSPREKNNFIDEYNKITKKHDTKGYNKKAICSVEKQQLFES